MYQFIMIIHVLAAVCVILLVLLQQGKGATMGAAFGSGASQTVFGSRGSGSFLLRLTMGLVVVFFSTSIALNYMATKIVKQPEAMSGLSARLQHADTAEAPPAPLPSSIPTNVAPVQTTVPQQVTPSSIPALPAEQKEKK